jgi:glycosyltransferase involved in cell wall biosynthesis
VFTGTVPHAAMGEIMASADIFLFPSETDTAGNVVLEAQACGLPVLVTDRGGPRENIRNGETGFVCSAGSERDFCWHAAQLLADHERRRRMGRTARAFASARTWPEALRPLFASYQESLRSAATRTGDRGRLSQRASAHV